MGQSSTIPFPKGDLKVSRNGRGAKGKALTHAQPDDADVRYAAALKLVQVIDRNLQNGTRHYYDTQGRLLTTLDEVIHAALSDTLALGKPAEYPQDTDAIEWVSANELVA